MSDAREQWRYWLALFHAPGVGPVGFQQLLQRHSDPQALFEHPPHSSDSRLAAYLRHPDWQSVDNDLAWLEQEGCHLLTFADPRYPQPLREIPDPPPLLFVRGDPAVLQDPQLAMVGSRNPTVSGRETAQDFARTLAAAGLVVTSGMALGIDTACHQGALQGGGQTIAVAGTGLDRVYPAANRELAHAIVQQGGVIVSEFSPGTPPLAGNFPKRNRIISGLSLGTLVVEAALRSGSLVTARLAMEQGREVFAIPGSIHNPLARGCHQLIRQGAKLVESASDILEELAPQLHVAIEGMGAEIVQADEGLDSEYQALLGVIGYETTPVDQMVERSGLTAETVSSMLLILELKGLVAAAPGGYTRMP